MTDSMGKPNYDYESAVYSDIADAMVDRMRAIIDNESISDPRARACIIAAALLTVAQALDGNDMPSESYLLKRNGVAHVLADLVAGKTIK